MPSDAVNGLSAGAAAARLARDGPNEIVKRVPTPAWRRFLAQFEDALVILLLIATAISIILWWVDRDGALPYEALAILAVVLFNATLGFIQEARDRKSVV